MKHFTGFGEVYPYKFNLDIEFLQVALLPSKHCCTLHIEWLGTLLLS